MSIARLLLLTLLQLGSLRAVLAFREFSAVGHHRLIVRTHTVAEAEATLAETLRSLFGNEFDEVRLDQIRRSLPVSSSSSSDSPLLFTATFRFVGNLSRAAILEKTQDGAAELTLVRLSKGRTTSFDRSRLPAETAIHVLLNELKSKSAALSEVSTNSSICSGTGILLPNSTCVCDAFFSGDDCSVMACNGGILRDGRCACPPGRPADHCQPKTCSASISSNIDLSKRSFVAVISLKTTMARDLNAIIPGLSAVVSDLDKSGVYINYQMLTYIAGLDGFAILHDVYYDTAAEFVDALEELALSRGTERQPTLAAVRLAMNAFPLLHPHSSIVVFSDSLPSDAQDWQPLEYNKTREIQIIETTIAWSHRLFLVVSDTDAQPLDVKDHAFASLDQITASTHGTLVHTRKTQLPVVLSAALPQLHLSENVAFAPAYPCGNHVERRVVVDDDVDVFHVIVQGALSLFARGLEAPETDETRITPVVDVVGFQVFTVNVSLPRIRLEGQPELGFCSYRIAVQSPRTILAAFSADERIDVGWPTSTQGLKHNVALLPRGGAASAPPSFFTLDVISYYDGAKEQGVKVAARAAMCNFPFVAALSTTCDPGPYSINVLSADKDGLAQYTRVLPAFCERPEQHSPDGWTCLHGGTRQVAEDGSVTCACVDNFSGDHCEIVACFNGGRPNAFPTLADERTLCECAAGWAGVHCQELVSCTSPAPSPEKNASQRAFVLVLQASLSQSYVADYLLAAIKPEFDAVYSTFFLTTFNRVLVAGKPTERIEIAAANSSDGLQQLLMRVKYQYTPDATQPISNAVTAALVAVSAGEEGFAAMTLLVVTDAADDALGKNAVKKATSATTAISVLRTSLFGDECNGAFKPTSLHLLTQRTGGAYVDICGREKEAIVKLLPQLALHPGQLLDAVLAEGAKSISELNKENNGDPPASPSPSGVHVELQYKVVDEKEEATFQLRINPFSALSPGDVNVSMFSDGKTTGTASLSFSDNSLLVYDLPMEKASYRVSIAIAKALEVQCLIYSSSPHTLYTSFTALGASDVIATQPNFGHPVVPVVHVQADAYTPRSATFSASSLGGDVTFTSEKGVLRSNCTFELLWPANFACAAHDDVFISKACVLVDETRFISRAFYTYCGLQDGAYCVHGIIRPDGSGKCECDVGYAGDFCDRPECENGAASSNDVCQCGELFSGRFCEYEMCTSWDFLAAHDPRAFDFRAVTLVAETTQAALIADIYLKGTMQKFVDAVDSVGGSKQFSLLTYGEKTFQTVVSTLIAPLFLFYASPALGSVETGYPKSTVAFTALDSAMLQDVPAPHIVFVFLSSSSQPNLDVFRRILIQHPGVQVNVIYSPYNTPEPMLPTTSPFYLWEAVAHQSGGRVLPLTQAYTYYLHPTLASMVRESALLYTAGAKDCTGGFNFSFVVDPLATRVVVYFVGVGASRQAITLTAPNGEAVGLVGKAVLAGDASLMVVEYLASDITIAGSWSAVFKTTEGRCSVQARAETAMRMEIGFTSDSHNDFPHELPFGVGAYNMSLGDGMITVALQRELVMSNDAARIDKITVNSFDPTFGTHTVKQIVAVSRRDPHGCASQFVSAPVQLKSQGYLSIIVSGQSKTDKGAVPFMRTFIVNNVKQDCGDYGSVTLTGECACVSGWSGDICERPLCGHGGTAAAGVCLCASGYQGEHCEEIVNPHPPTPPPTTTTLPTTTAAPTTGASGSTDFSAGTATTTAEASTASSTPKLPCYFETTDYDIAVFIDAFSLNNNVIDFARQVFSKLAQLQRFGDLSKSFYEIVASNKETLFTTPASSIADLDAAFIDARQFTDVDNANVFNLNSSLTKFAANDKLLANFTAKPSLIIIVAGHSPSAPVAEIVVSLRALPASFRFVLLAVTEEATSLKEVVDRAGLFVLPNDAVDFLKTAICDLGPH